MPKQQLAEFIEEIQSTLQFSMRERQFKTNFFGNQEVEMKTKLVVKHSMDLEMAWLENKNLVHMTKDLMTITTLPSNKYTQEMDQF